MREPGSSVLELARRSHGNAVPPLDQSRGYFPLPSHAGSVADQLSPTCVLSTHKSQGSEFPCVVIPLHTQHYLMLQRNLLYTAVTRGRKLVIIMGTKKALAMAIRRSDTGRKYMALRKRRRAGYEWLDGWITEGRGGRMCGVFCSPVRGGTVASHPPAESLRRITEERRPILLIQAKTAPFRMVLQRWRPLRNLYHIRYLRPPTLSLQNRLRNRRFQVRILRGVLLKASPVRAGFFCVRTFPPEHSHRRYVLFSREFRPALCSVSPAEGLFPPDLASATDR